MKILAVVALLIGLVAFIQKATAANPEDFTGTWNGRQTFIGYGFAWDLGMTLEIGCVNGRLTVYGDVENNHQNPNVPVNLHINGQASEIIQKGNELIITIPYYWFTKSADKRRDSQNVMRYTFSLAGDQIDGPALQLNTHKQFYAKLNRTGAMVACVVTPPSAG